MKRSLLIAAAAVLLVVPVTTIATPAEAGPPCTTARTLCLGDVNSRVRVNQVGYLTDGPKEATVVTTKTTPLPWRLRDAAGTVVARGSTTPRGVDATSGQNVQTADFSAYHIAGTGLTLAADGDTSVPFDVGVNAAYERMRVDALSFFYTQRSGIKILGSIAPGYGRAAGHLGVPPNRGDTDVPCQPGVCDYRLDVRGGWYDAGDQGKYVVNGAIAVYELMSTFEHTKLARAEPGRLGNGSLRIPERGNGVPDILDEARWELEFMLRMRVPAGQPLAGMVHHKVHDRAWTALPLDPAADPQPRELHPPSTAATLDLAATAAQGARLFQPYDGAFAARLLAAARNAWTAAAAHPAIYAPSSDNVGGGAYDDNDVSDEFYWAAAELYLSTGEQAYRDAVMASPWHTADVFRPQGFGWQFTATAGRLDLATVPSALPDRTRVRQSVADGAKQYLAIMRANPYDIAYAPLDGKFDWGSNDLVLSNLMVIATAFDITGDRQLRDGVVRGMDYLLGRNALQQSYVTGFGARSSHNQHSRMYAHQLDAALPSPPAGSLAGGPNSSIQDPVASNSLRGCAPQSCYIDDIQAWSTNEVAINWNATLAWVASFLADQGEAGPLPRPACSVSYGVVFGFGHEFLAMVTVRGTSGQTLHDWKLRYAYTGTQTVTWAFNATARQTAASVEVTPWHSRLRPGESTTILLAGRVDRGPDTAPAFFSCA
ncbi:glycoside hydrolase family 9 protein [Dactylosporangium sp. NPDC051484]|uniref:glycoside hydrolase family 9 protein n=1 Tax=Dactylosporangium sp. NPDC051484 TaxID=3154942 RepID=UPI0034506B4E